MLPLRAPPAAPYPLRPARPEDEAAVLALLRSYPGLEVAFDAREFTVIEAPDGIAACARLRRHADGSWEIASLAVRQEARGTGLGARILAHVLADVPPGRPVYALALVPGFFAKHGFRAIPKVALPAVLTKKAKETCAGTGFVAMVRM